MSSTTPIWAGRFQTFRAQTYERWLRNVVRVTGGVWDFSGINPVTADMRNYYDDGHFTEAVGDRVLEAVYVRRHDGVGVFVDARTVERRIAEIRRDFAELARTAPDPRRSPPDKAHTGARANPGHRSISASD